MVAANTYKGCRNNAARAIWEDAKLRGADFRAVGNEPGWYLEISQATRLLFVSDYGQSRYEFEAAAPMTDQNARRTEYRANDAEHTLSILIEGDSCHDTMSGEVFESRVTVILDNTEYRGCGKALH